MNMAFNNEPAPPGAAQSRSEPVATSARLEGYLPDECERIDVAGIDYVSIAVGRLGQSIDFYTQTFGFFVVEDARGGQEPYVLMRAPGDFYIAIYERGDERAQAREATRRWSFLVNDLDRVRETVWNLGLATKGACDEPTQLHRWRKDRSFLVCDPDGHEIELVERWSGRDIQRWCRPTKIPVTAPL